jgi:hypothetical protein
MQIPRRPKTLTTFVAILHGSLLYTTPIRKGSQRLFPNGDTRTRATKTISHYRHCGISDARPISEIPNSTIPSTHRNKRTRTKTYWKPKGYWPMGITCNQPRSQGHKGKGPQWRTPQTTMATIYGRRPWQRGHSRPRNPIRIGTSRRVSIASRLRLPEGTQETVRMLR